MIKAIYAASLDPIHYGHINIIERASKAFNELVIAIGVNPEKRYAFTLEERLDMARKSLSKFRNVRVESFGGLFVDYAYEQGISVSVKGARNSSDFDYERMLHQIGESQKLGIDSFVLFARPETAHISSGVIKAIQKEQGLIHEYVPLYVKQKLEGRLSEQYIVGLSGEIGSGKTYVAKKFVELGKDRDIPVYNIELDEIGHQILEELRDEKYREVRETIAEEFGKKVRLGNGFIDRKVLGEIVFSDDSKLQRLNEIMNDPIIVRLRREIYGEKGLIILNAALIVETNMSHLCNNNVILVRSDEKIRNKRLLDRRLNEEQIRRRNLCQYNFELKKEKLERAIKRDNNGKLWFIDNSSTKEDMEVENTFEDLLRYFKLGGV